MSWLDPSSARLHTDEDLALVAAILDEHETLSAMLLRKDFSVATYLTDAGAESLGNDAESAIADSVPIKTRFDTVGVGWGVRDGEGSITVVYITADESAAADAVGRSVRPSLTRRR